MGLVGAGLSVVGTVVGIAERNSVNAQRNAQLAEQQRAMTRASFQRLVSLQTRQQFAAMQTELELLTNASRASQQLSAVETQLQSAKLQAANIFLQTQQGQAQAALEQIKSQFDARNVQFERQQEGFSAALQAAQQASQELEQRSQLYTQLSDALAKGDVAMANAVVQSMAAKEKGTKQGGDSSYQTESERTVQEAMLNRRNYEINMQLLQSGAADTTTIDSILRSQEFQKILNDTGVLEADSINTQAQILRNLRERYLSKQNEGTQAGYSATVAGLNALYDIIPNDLTIRNNQALINQGFQNIYLRETQDGVYNELEAQNAGLEAQKQSSSALSDIFSVLNAGYPLITGMFKSQERASSSLVEPTILSTSNLSLMTPNEIAISTVNTADTLNRGYSGTTVPYFEL